MYRKRGVVLTLNSLKTLQKVCRFPRSHDSFKSLALLRNFSTATERLPFDNSGGLTDDDYKRNPNGLYGDGIMQMNHGQGRNRNVRANNSGGFQGSPDRFRGGGNNGSYQQNPTGVYGETVASGKFGTFDSNSTSFNERRNGQNNNGVIGGVSGRNGEGQRNEFQQSRQNVNFGWGGSENMQQNLRSEFHRRPEGNGGNFSNWNPRESHINEEQQRLEGQIPNFGNGFRASQNNAELNRGMPGYNGEVQRKDFQQSMQNASFGRGGSNNMQQNLSEFHRRSDGNGKNFSNGNPRESHRLEGQIPNFGNGGSFWAPQNNAELNRGMPGYNGEGQRKDFQQSMQNASFGWGGSNNMQQNFSEFQRRPDGNGQNFSNVYPRESHRNEKQESLVGQSANFGNGEQNVNGSSAWNNPIDVRTSGYSGGNGLLQPQAVNYNVGNMRASEYNYGNYNAGRRGNDQNMQVWPNSNNAGIQPQSLGAVSQHNDESAGVDEHMVLKGTIQELDDFLKVGNLEEAVKVLALLEKQRIVVDLPRYLALMKACGENGSLDEAKAIHNHFIRSMPNLELGSYNKILEMYSACGSMKDAFRVFDAMPRDDLTSWDIMITGLAENGHAEAAIDLFTEFKELGLKPNGEMYLGVFMACKALLDTTEGMLHFETMSKNFGIVPSMEHYVGVVDMFGSVGCLDEALEFIEKMPVQPGVEVWEKLMNLSRIQGNTELGDRCAEILELLDPSLLNEQSRAGLLSLNASELGKEKVKKKKESGQNPLEVRSRVHEYRAGDRSDPDHEKLYTLLMELKQQMKEAGYVPELKGVLHDIDPESKEEALLSHSERLAVARGFLSTPARQPMRVIKNLRICVDCHNAMKIISQLVGRELIMRDAKRFHHFKDGICSCRDYW